LPYTPYDDDDDHHHHHHHHQQQQLKTGALEKRFISNIVREPSCDEQAIVGAFSNYSFYSWHIYQE
jgi:hypothetical protein